MGKINVRRIVFSIFCLIILVTANAQQSFSSDKIIGDWINLSSEKPRINDTIILYRINPNQTLSEYSKWKFSKSNIFEIVIYKVLPGDENKWVEISEKKDTEDNWNYNISTNELVIQQKKVDQIFKVTSVKKDMISFIRIK